MYIAGLLMGIVAGFVMHRSDYCVTGMFRDAILFKNFFMLRSLLLQVTVSMIFFETLRRSHFLPLFPFPLLAPPALSNIVGGMVFGLGMVLAGGCVVGTLYKLGAGSLISATAFLGLILGSALYAELHPWWASLVRQTVLTKEALTLPALLNIDPTLVILTVALPASWLCIRWWQTGRLTINTSVRGYLQPWKAALILAVIGASSYVAIGMPMGITNTYAKFAAIIENAIIPAHVSRNPFFAAQPLDIVHPASGALLHGGAGPALDSIWTIQFPLIAGIILGSFISALLLKEYLWHTRIPGRQLAMAFIGGIILALGSRMTPGCNIWHLMGGLPILALSSLLFVIGLLPGAWLGSKILTRVVMSSSRG
ncbi:MAG: YeeE/YedE family protein [Proteobacteria bacterium]|nr:YeeE/YedE family protein [Desulfobulbaceae bacterium]MBU4151862.1 YeeE/YedE family protein [Pseudomonadota bacterium]